MIAAPGGGLNLSRCSSAGEIEGPGHFHGQAADVRRERGDKQLGCEALKAAVKTSFLTTNKAKGDPTNGYWNHQYHPAEHHLCQYV